MTLKFVTGNKDKFDEVQDLLGLEIEQLELDIDEVQSMDQKEIIEKKLLKAIEISGEDELIVEDTGFYMEALNGLPGPLIKFFFESLGRDGLYNISKRFENYNAIAKTVVGYAKEGELYFFEGMTKGTVVESRGERFAWDSVFEPELHDKTYAEMTIEEKNKLSQRAKAFNKLKEFLRS